MINGKAVVRFGGGIGLGKGMCNNREDTHVVVALRELTKKYKTGDIIDFKLEQTNSQVYLEFNDTRSIDMFIAWLELAKHDLIQKQLIEEMLSDV